MLPYTLEIDAVGLHCPMPLLKLKQGLNALNAGDVVKITVTDPAAHLDFGVFCQQACHEILATQAQDTMKIFYIKKA
ncbi:MAG TPA: SirA-like domain-containing protein [Methylococcaceae bacterium]|nr:SirA-like domain-containing protein [Methylococcaceae bacterium]